MPIKIDPDLVHKEHPKLGAVLLAEERRQQAMLDGDVERLRALLSDHAVYIHSSGLIDDEITYLPPLENKDVRYKSIEMEVFKVRCLGRDAFLISGSALMQTIQYGERRELDNLFIMTWIRSPDGWQMSSWQSTPSKVK